MFVPDDRFLSIDTLDMVNDNIKNCSLGLVSDGRYENGAEIVLLAAYDIG